MKRVAPDPEFVLMYRKGIPTSKIAALEDVPRTTVRYHLQIAARAEPGIRDEHKAALPPPARRMPEAGMRNLADVTIYSQALAVIPGWDKPSTRKADDEARWQQRLEELQKIRAAGGDWPRHQKTDDTHERTLGVWLHGQRIDYRAGRLNPTKEKRLNDALPGWRDGRGHRGGRRTNRHQKPSDPNPDQL